MSSLYDYQEASVKQLMDGKKIIYAGMGMGKNPMSMVWASRKCKETGKNKILVITTASKARTNDHWNDLCAFCPDFVKGLDKENFVVISWHKLSKWVSQNWETLKEWVVVADEIQRSKGYTTGMGKAFLKIVRQTQDWSGWTGTPGDSWDSFITYFTATKQVKNKTAFMNEFATIQTYKGYPEIVGWRNEDKLKDMWAKISYAPDTSIVASQLPKSVKVPITFSLPKTYSTVLKTRMRANSDGNNLDDFLDTPGALCAELRRVCFTKDKQEWVSDFISSLDSGVVVFYNFVATGDKLEETITKALPNGAKVWRIDGKHHDIPTADTIGARDIVLCQWQSGSEALNFQMIHYMLIAELPYSYSMLKQGMGRIRRIGQEHTMFFYTLLCDKGIEQDIKEILQTKGEFSEKNWCISNDLIKEEE